MSFSYDFGFEEDNQTTIRGRLRLDLPQTDERENLFRSGTVELEKGGSLELCLYHNPHTRKFIYLRDAIVSDQLADLTGLKKPEYDPEQLIRLPGQLSLGAERSELTGKAIREILLAPILGGLIAGHRQDQIAVFPIAREGLKYQVAECLFQDFGFYCDEVMLDAHHVFDRTVPIYNRKVEMTLFKDKDLDPAQKKNMRVAVVADSIASGLVMREVIRTIHARFERITHIEIISPLATLRGMSRIIPLLHEDLPPVRVHVFETILNALPPDYYYSAHFADPAFHLEPEAEAEYREWWGRDNFGNVIADTACAGYGWSEAFFSPRKQIQMMNKQLYERHKLEITDILRRNLQKTPPKQ